MAVEAETTETVESPKAGLRGLGRLLSQPKQWFFTAQQKEGSAVPPTEHTAQQRWPSRGDDTAESTSPASASPSAIASESEATTQSAPAAAEVPRSPAAGGTGASNHAGTSAAAAAGCSFIDVSRSSDVDGVGLWMTQVLQALAEEAGRNRGARGRRSESGVREASPRRGLARGGGGGCGGGGGGDGHRVCADEGGDSGAEARDPNTTKGDGDGDSDADTHGASAAHVADVDGGDDEDKDGDADADAEEAKKEQLAALGVTASALVSKWREAAANAGLNISDAADAHFAAERRRLLAAVSAATKSLLAAAVVSRDPSRATCDAPLDDAGCGGAVTRWEPILYPLEKKKKKLQD